MEVDDPGLGKSSVFLQVPEQTTSHSMAFNLGGYHFTEEKKVPFL